MLWLRDVVLWNKEHGIIVVIVYYGFISKSFEKTYFLNSHKAVLTQYNFVYYLHISNANISLKTAIHNTEFVGKSIRNLTYIIYKFKKNKY